MAQTVGRLPQKSKRNPQCRGLKKKEFQMLVWFFTRLVRKEQRLFEGWHFFLDRLGDVS